MIQKTLVGVALVGSIVALVISIIARPKPLSTDDQPIIMAGGSLTMHSELPWTLEKGSGSTPHAYKNNSALSVERVEWSCDYDSDPTVSTRAGVMAVDIRYAKPSSTEYHTVKYFTKADGTELRIQMLKSVGTTVGYPLLRTLVELGEHPRSAWKATMMASTGLNPNITCNNLTNGEFFLAIHPCRGTGCP